MVCVEDKDMILLFFACLVDLGFIYLDGGMCWGGELKRWLGI